MKSFALLLALLIAGCVATPVKSAGTCIGSNFGYKTCSFGISVQPSSNPRLAIVTSQRSTSANTAKWKPLKQITVKGDSATRSLEYGSCRLKGVPSDTVIALVPAHGPNDPEFLKAVDWAYNVDLPSGNFLPIDPLSVDCANTAIGAD